MIRSWKIEWAAFAGGTLAAGILWLFVHAPGFEGQLSTTIGNESPKSEAQSQVQSQAQSQVQSQAKRLSDGPASERLQGGSPSSENPDPGKSDSVSGSLPVTQGLSPLTQGLTPLEPNSRYPEPFVRVYLSESKTVETVSLETYVRGVVAAEMPLDFEPAALEAQALAARTYILRRLMNDDRTGMPVQNADVTDTQTHQAYRSISRMSKLLVQDREGWMKADQACRNTRGLIIAYEGQPIDALYFSTSNGYTENSEDVFPFKLPYLRSVESPWDKEGAPRSKETVEMPLKRFYELLGAKSAQAMGPIVAGAGGGKLPIRVTERSEGQRVKMLAVGTLKLPGTEVRSMLGLRSSSFEWVIKGSKIFITTYGSGHGVGMSQWGAEGMAKAGSTSREIVEHYYPGVNLMEVSKLPNGSTL
ncbi:stage II sporulation protein D [Cohnella faecalis]|uniref:Stage II sporulation protein D n=1 Tax=Cohnella faecalis TaxID=2315694 RepID=A0A398CSS6_9BACL|nr:stage II sporulation protein D [Cohnella faecalis]RIE02014.1 stage II sporulation protein D [Cohnella faecalis]